MAEMKTLTINGKTYTVADPDAGTANIDDSKLGTDAWSSLNIVDKLAPAFTESGAVVSCSPVEGYPLGVVSRITPVQEGSGDPSPDNVRPITGWTGAKLHRGGKNLCPFGTIEFTMYVRKELAVPLPAGMYTFSAVVQSADTDDTVCAVIFMGETGAVLSKTVNRSQTDEQRVSQTYAVTKPITAIQFYAANGAANGIGDTASFTDIQIEVGPVATDYEPYCGEDITLDFGETVYGGSIDWNTGVLIVDTFSTVIPSTSVNMAEGADIQYTVTSYFGGPKPVGGVDGTYCNRFNPNINLGNGDGSGNRISIYNSGIIRYRDGVSTNAVEARTWAAENPIQIAYRIAEPYTIQLTPQELLALSGVNTLHTDTGDTQVSGRADPPTVIADLYAKITEIQAAIVNNA